jgi:hypothetical protein
LFFNFYLKATGCFLKKKVNTSEFVGTKSSFPARKNSCLKNEISWVLCQELVLKLKAHIYMKKLAPDFFGAA